MRTPGVDRIVLVGFMGAGKSSVGRRLAGRLGWRAVDLDQEIERRSGRSIPEWFAQAGEAAFRDYEAEVAEACLAETELVVATGGGWAAAPGRLETLPPGSMSVWLRVGVGEALGRLRADPAPRPLLEVEDPEPALRKLMDQRRSAYDRADVGVDTDGRSVDDVTSKILEILASRKRTETE